MTQSGAKFGLFQALPAVLILKVQKKTM